MNMRVAIISDIHGNLEALSSVLIDIRDKNVDRIICLGDVIGYGPNPNECINVVETHCEYCLLGNHESAVFDKEIAMEFNKHARFSIEWTRNCLNLKSIDFIKKLEIVKIEEDFTSVHATPYRPGFWSYISSMEEALFSFNFFKTKFCLIGHTHIPGVIVSERRDSNITILPPRSFDYETGFNKDARFIVNVGSVGQSRDKNPKSCYVIIDTDLKKVCFFRVPYDIALYQKKMRIAGMPEFLITRIVDGY